MCKYKALVSIIAIGVIEMYALSLGMNGTALSLSVGAMRVWVDMNCIKKEW